MKTLALCLFVFVFGRLSEQFSISTQIVVDQQETPTRLDGQDNWDSATLRFALEIHVDRCYTSEGQSTIGALKDHIKGIGPDNKQKRILRIVSINTTNIAAQAANANIPNDYWPTTSVCFQLFPIIYCAVQYLKIANTPVKLDFRNFV